MRELNDYVRVYDGVFTKDKCEYLIELFEETRDREVQEYRTEAYNFDQLELNTSKWGARQCNSLYTSLVPVYKKHFEEVGVSDYLEIHGVEALRIKKYEQGSDQEFKTHIDVTDHATARRYAVAIVYLNDNDGHTVFPNLDIVVEPKAGRVVVFPPMWMFPHAGLTPKDCDKYIMMTCLHYT